jgi:hypothetical protein
MWWLYFKEDEKIQEYLPSFFLLCLLLGILRGKTN